MGLKPPNMTATLLSSLTATLGQPESSLVLTSGSTVQINAPAQTVFEHILNTNAYRDWNTWCPQLTFAEHEDIRTPGTVGTLHCWMEAEKRSFKIPVKILEASSSADRYVLAWRGQLMPTWFAIAERVQIVERVSDSVCVLRQWESMSGWGAYVLKYLLRMQTQLDQPNLLYANDLKAYAERS